MSLDDFWRGIGGCPTNGLPEFSEMSGATESEVDKFHVPMLIEEDVLGLDVPVAESALL